MKPTSTVLLLRLRRINRQTCLLWFFFATCLVWRVTSAHSASKSPILLVWRTDVIATDGANSTMVLDQAGLPHLAYDNYSTLFYAHWTGNQWVTATVAGPPSPDVQIVPDKIALDSQSHPHLLNTSCNEIYCTSRYVKWTGSQWITNTLPAGHPAPFQSRPAVRTLALDATDRPHVTYWEFTALDVAPFERIDRQYGYQTSTGWVTATVQGNVGQITIRSDALQLDQTGIPHIIYAADPHTLVYASLSNSVWVTQVVDSALSGRPLSTLALDQSNQPHLSYLQNDGQQQYLKYAVQTGQQWAVQVVDTIPITDTNYVQPALALDSDGYPHIAYNRKDELRYAQWTGNDWLIYRIAFTIEQGGYFHDISLALDQNDLPRIAYSQSGNNKPSRVKFVWSEQPQHQLYLPLLN